MNFVVSFAISLFSGVMKEASVEFGVQVEEMQLALTVYILGLAFGRSSTTISFKHNVLIEP